jgi:ADP-ribose pyrophosphatase
MSSSLHFPAIVRTKRTRISPWLELIEKAVRFGPEQPLEVYHCITQDAYVAVLVRTADGLIPIVRQYRPCVEDYTWELPAGTLNQGETAEQAARRELLEETGLEAGTLLYLGNFHPDTGRLQLDSHAFYGTVKPPARTPHIEEGITVLFVTHAELKRMITAGEFRHQLHLAVYGAILARGLGLD